MARLNMSVTIGGVSISGAITRAVGMDIGEKVTLAAGKAGTLTTRTDNDTGVITVATGHGIATGEANKVDLYWAGGLRRGMTVGTVTSTTIPLDGGTGDNLPIATTAIVVCVRTIVNVDFDGDEVAMLAVSGTLRHSVSIQQDDGTVIKEYDLGRSGVNSEMEAWAEDLATANPLAGVDVGKIVMSNGGITAGSVSFGAVIDNVA